MAYDGDASLASGRRRDAERQLADTDDAFLLQATELAAASGDRRVLLAAELALELAKSPTERAGGNDPTRSMCDRLRAELTALDAAAGGEPVALSLSYPNGWGPPRAGVQVPADTGNSDAVPATAAARIAMAYRAALDD
jgi:hypothetical protein